MIFTGKTPFFFPFSLSLFLSRRYRRGHATQTSRPRVSRRAFVRARARSTEVVSEKAPHPVPARAEGGGEGQRASGAFYAGFLAPEGGVQ